MLFGNPPGDFSSRPGCFFSSSFFKIPPLPLIYPRGDGDGDGDRFPQKIYIPPRGELRGYYGILSTELLKYYAHQIDRVLLVPTVRYIIQHRISYRILHVVMQKISHYYSNQ